mmetsp:Transcript_45667/g.114269  ORF Transcript_45667/g.114269 Transcript_45667/m.114269 type:complete len:422 (-) Transcript_45667:453-1718(-)
MCSKCRMTQSQGACAKASAATRNLSGTSSLPWAAALRRAWQASQDREDSFQLWETDMASTVAPVGNPVDRAGDTTTGTLDLPPRLTLGELPSLNSAIDEAKGLRKVAAVLSHTRKWRVFFDLYKTATLPERIRLLSQSGHGSVTYLTSDTPAAYAVEPEPYRVALRKCCGIAALGDSPLGLEDSCPHCDLSPGATDEALERHIVRCPRAGAWHKVHARIATTMVSILQEAGAPRDSVLTEVRGLRSADATRPGDVVQLDYMGPGVHLVLDAAVTGVFRNSIAAQVAVQPGYAARLREQTKFRVDACSSQPVARRHRFVPCVVEEGGRLGEHLLALLKELAERGIASGHLKQPPSWRELRPAALVAHWIRKWTAKLSVALHIFLAEYLCRHTGSRPFGFGGRSFRPAGRQLPATSPGPAARR